MGSALGFRLNDSSRRAIEARTGMSVSEISSLEIEDIASRVERKAGRRFKSSTFSDVVDQLGRGQVYPFAGRLISRKFIDKNN